VEEICNRRRVSSPVLLVLGDQKKRYRDIDLVGECERALCLCCCVWWLRGLHYSSPSSRCKLRNKSNHICRENRKVAIKKGLKRITQFFYPRVAYCSISLSRSSKTVKKTASNTLWYIMLVFFRAIYSLRHKHWALFEHFSGVFPENFFFFHKQTIEIRNISYVKMEIDLEIEKKLIQPSEDWGEVSGSQMKLREYGTLKYCDVHEKIRFLEIQDLTLLKTCQKHFKTIFSNFLLD